MAQVVDRRHVRRTRPSLAHRPPATAGIVPASRRSGEALLSWACAVSAALHVITLLWLAEGAADDPPVLLAVQTGRASIALRASIAGQGARQGEAQAEAEESSTPVTIAATLWAEEARAEAAAQAPIAAPSVAGAPLDCRSTAPWRPDSRAEAAVVVRPVPTSDASPPAPTSASAVTAIAAASERYDAVAQSAVVESAGAEVVRPPRAELGLPDADGGADDSLAAPASAGSRAAEGADVDDLPVAVSNPAPVYPPELLAARVTGTVRLRIRVAADGRVASARVEESSGQEAFDQAALRAVRRWRFQPARRDGQAVAVEVVQRVNFVLPEE